MSTYEAVSVAVYVVVFCWIVFGVLGAISHATTQEAIDAAWTKDKR